MTIQDDIENPLKGDAWEFVGAVDMGQTNNAKALSQMVKRKQNWQHIVYSLYFMDTKDLDVLLCIKPRNCPSILYVNIWGCVDVLMNMVLKWIEGPHIFLPLTFMIIVIN